MHHSQRERRIGARSNRDPLVALRRGARSDRVDRDDLRAALARLEYERPEMRIRRERVGAPEQNQIALGNRFRIGADVWPTPVPMRKGWLIEQIVRSSSDAPMRWKNRRSVDEP